MPLVAALNRIRRENPALQQDRTLRFHDCDHPAIVCYSKTAGDNAIVVAVNVDPHAMQWSRQRANQFFQEQVGKKEGEAQNEIDRYCSWPGQACAYKIGQTEILRQRDLARTQLGAAFDVRAFNQAVVEGGNCPLDVLAGNVERYIAAAKA